MDWQAYLDGSLSPAEMRQAEELLKADARAQAQVEGLRAFRHAIKQAGQSVDVPLDRLHRLVPRTPPKISFLTRLAWIPPTLAVIFGGWFLFRVTTGMLHHSSDPMSLDQSPPVAALQTSSMSQATAWIAQKTSLVPPPMAMIPGGRLMTVHCGKNWATLEFVYHALPYNLTLCTNTAPLQAGHRFKTSAGTFLTGIGIGWTANNFGYYLKGGDATTREQVAAWFRQSIAPRATPKD